LPVECVELYAKHHKKRLQMPLPQLSASWNTATCLPALQGHFLQMIAVHRTELPCQFVNHCYCCVIQRRYLCAFLLLDDQLNYY
jgi:hypothetical protein